MFSGMCTQNGRWNGPISRTGVEMCFLAATSRAGSNENKPLPSRESGLRMITSASSHLWQQHLLDDVDDAVCSFNIGGSDPHLVHEGFPAFN